MKTSNKFLIILSILVIISALIFGERVVSDTDMILICCNIMLVALSDEMKNNIDESDDRIDILESRIDWLEDKIHMILGSE